MDPTIFYYISAHSNKYFIVLLYIFLKLNVLACFVLSFNCLNQIVKNDVKVCQNIFSHKNGILVHFRFKIKMPHWCSFKCTEICLFPLNLSPIHNDI